MKIFKSPYIKQCTEINSIVKTFNYHFSGDRDRDYRGGNNRRDEPRRGNFTTEIRREEPAKEPKRERVVKDFEERMPKFQAPAGPVSFSTIFPRNFPLTLNDF